MFCVRAVLRSAAFVPAFLLLSALATAQLPRLPLQGPRTPAAPAAPIPLPLANPAAPAQLTSADVTAFLDGFLPLQMQRDDVAGATVSITQDGQPLLLKGYGYADWKRKIPVDPVATTFRPGSISKLFTYTAMMQQVELGRLNLDADIQQYLDFPLAPGPRGIGHAPISLRNLATHTGGFEEELHDFGSDKSGHLPIDLRTYLVRNQPHRFAAPGTQLAYSNYGISLIGYIVQRVSGESFESYIQRHIFTPLGMIHSTFVQPLPKGMIASLGYLKTSKPDTGFEGVTPVPAGALSSTAADMAIFGQMLLGHGTFNGRTVLQPGSVTQLFTPQFRPAPGVSPWDLGFYDEDRNGLRFIGHGGDLIACHSQFWVEPTHGLVFFISYNSAGAAGEAREELFRAFVDRYLPGPAAPHPPYLTLSAKDLAPYTGTFLSSRRSDSTKFRLLDSGNARDIKATKDGYLTLSSAKDPRGELLRFHPVGNDNFYEETSQNTLHFICDAHGKVVGTASPSHTDRAPVGMNQNMLLAPLLIALLTLLCALLAPAVRFGRRWLFPRRPRPLPQPGTRWLTRPLQLALLACLLPFAELIYMAVTLSDVSTFLQIGHLDPWFIAQNILTAIALVAIVFGIVSGLKALAEPLRAITKLKFSLAVFSCVFYGWFFLYFHFVGNAHRY